MSVEIFIISLLNGLSYALLLFLLSAGLTLVFGLMRTLNLAHGSFYMLGAYLGYTLTQLLGLSFMSVLCLTPCIVGVLGFLTDRYLISQLRERNHLTELLLTYGIALVIFALVQFFWGKSPVANPIPTFLQGSAFEWFGFQFPLYKLAIIVIALLVLLLIACFLYFQHLGLLLRATAQDPMMLETFGFNVRLWMSYIFAFGCALAGLAGVMGGIAYVTEPAMAQSMGMLLFVIIVVGGIGSLKGAFLASLLIGLLHSLLISLDLRLAQIFLIQNVELGSWLSISTSQLAPVVPFMLMILVLWLRPQGLCGVKAGLRV